MKNESKLSFLIAKSEANETLNDLDELLSCEKFSDEQAEAIDGIMKQIGDIDDDTSSAIGDLLLAVTSEQTIAKSCDDDDVESWPSLTGLEQDGLELLEIPCLVKKSELNQVDDFLLKFCTKAESGDDEIEVISSALETISDLDDDSLNAVHSLLKIEFSETTISKRWPSLFKEESESESSVSADNSSQPAKKKSGLKWPTRNIITGTVMKKHSDDILNPLTGQYRKADENDERQGNDEPSPRWPSISG